MANGFQTQQSQLAQLLQLIGPALPPEIAQQILGAPGPPTPDAQQSFPTPVLGGGVSEPPVQPQQQKRSSGKEALANILGDFLGGLGSGLTAASRAPIGRETGAGIGGGLQFGQRQQQIRFQQEQQRVQTDLQRAQAEQIRDRVRKNREFEEQERRLNEARISSETAASRLTRARGGLVGAQIPKVEAQADLLGEQVKTERLARPVTIDLAIARADALGAKADYLQALPGLMEKKIKAQEAIAEMRVKVANRRAGIAAGRLKLDEGKAKDVKEYREDLSRRAEEGADAIRLLRENQQDKRLVDTEDAQFKLENELRELDELGRVFGIFGRFGRARGLAEKTRGRLRGRGLTPPEGPVLEGVDEAGRPIFRR